MSFDNLDLPPELRQGLLDMRFTQATPIQLQSIPIAMEGRDMVGSSQTGSGKTAAFLIPIISRLMTVPGAGSRALILVPTRELAIQVEEQFLGLAYHTRLSIASVYGGVEMGLQERALKAGANVIVATPGRLLDHLRNHAADLSGIEILVLDEGDRMLDMGFLPDLERIFQKMPADRQSLLFSATFPSGVVGLISKLLKEPEYVKIGLDFTAAEGVRQFVCLVSDDKKRELLTELIRRHEMSMVLVFTRTKKDASSLWKFLKKHKVNADCMHSDLSQEQRLKALGDFRSGEARVLVATDIASRGLDVDNISHVINYNVPEDPESYVHRVGRTARYDAEGDAYTLVCPEEVSHLSAIEHLLGFQIERVRLDNFDYGKESQVSRPQKKFARPGRPFKGKFRPRRK
ncbi:MAG: DEAD/DEAH box helicase [Candidatus Omnitrophica bacterium]|nr:DEAD/DEAH box helicase [Candidatus Omnitrophota bacterium]